MPTIIGASVGNKSASGVLTLNKTLTAGSTLLLAIAESDSTGTSTSLPSISGGGGAWSMVVASTLSASHTRASIWRMDGATAGAATITITPNATGDSLAAGLTEWTALGAVDKTAISGAFSTTPSVGPTAATSAAAEVVIAAWANDGSNAGATIPATGYTNIANQANAVGVLTADYLITSSTGTQTASWGTQTTSDQWTAAMATFVDVGAITVPQVENPTTSFASHRVRDIGSVLVTGSLLLGTLTPQPIPLPVSADRGDLQVLQTHHPRNLKQQNQDTSRSMAKALTTDTSVQVKDFPFYQVYHPSRKVTANVDATHNSPLTLLAPVVTALPIGRATPQSAPLRYWFQPSDTSQQAWAGTIPAAAVINPFVVAPSIQVDRIKNVTDTSQQAWALSIPAAVVQAPFATTPWAAPDRAHYLTPDTSQSVSQSLSQAPAPFTTSLQALTDRARYSSDTSQGAFAILYPPATIYNDAITETVISGDSYNSTQVFNSGITETVTATDTDASTQVFVLTLGESTTLADQYNGGGSTTYNDTIAESLTMADALIASQVFVSSLSESFTVGDATDATAVYLSTLAESITLADGSVANFVAANTLAEAIAVADALGATQVMVTTIAEQVVMAATYTASGGGGGTIVWPDPSVVLLGVQYGPTGVEYTGTYVDAIRYELTTGRLVKPLGSKLSTLL